MKGKVFLFLILLLIPAVSSAGEPVFTLKEAIEAALRDNHSLKAVSASVEASGEDVGRARSYLLPRLTFEERFSRTTNPTYAFMSKLNQERFAASDFAITSLNDPDETDDFQTSVSFEQALFSEKARIGLKMAKEEASAQRESLKRKREEVALDTIKAFLDITTAREFVDVAKKGLEDAKVHERLAETRFNADMGLYSDVLRAKTYAAESAQRLVSAEKNLKLAKRGLGLLLGLESGADIGGEVTELKVAPLDQYSASALERSDLRAMRIRKSNAENNLSLARSEYLPMVGVGGAYYMNDHETPFGSEGTSWQAAAFLRWNIFDGGLREHEASKARLQAIEAAEHLNGMKKAVQFRVYEAYLAHEEAMKNTELAEASLKAAEEGTRLVRIRYENSLSPFVDLLDAELALEAARAGLVMRKNELKTAQAALSFEGGTILKDLGIE